MNKLDLTNISPRNIYYLVILALSWPLLSNFTLKPAEMKTAGDSYTFIEKLKIQPDQIVLISFDWGPSTSAENRPQTESVIEHLMRRGIPFAAITTYQYAIPFLESVPKKIAEKLTAEIPTSPKVYGIDWVNLGFQPNAGLMIQSLAKASDIQTVIRADANGTPLREIPCMKQIKTIKNIPLLAEFTGLVGVFNAWIQFFQVDGYRPEIIHGCTSITIVEAYTFYVTGQIKGLFEGVAGAAWYDQLLTDHFPKREKSDVQRINTSLATAHLLILGLIVLGNVSLFLNKKR